MPNPPPPPRPPMSYATCRPIRPGTAGSAFLSAASSRALGLLLEGRKVDHRWEGMVVYVAALRSGRWATVQEWVPGDCSRRSTTTSSWTMPGVWREIRKHRSRARGPNDSASPPVGKAAMSQSSEAVHLRGGGSRLSCNSMPALRRDVAKPMGAWAAGRESLVARSDADADTDARHRGHGQGSVGSDSRSACRWAPVQWLLRGKREGLSGVPGSADWVWFAGSSACRTG